MKRLIMKYLKNFYVRMVRLIHGIDVNSILFISFDGKSYSDNPRAISEKLYETDMTVNIKWILSSRQFPFLPEYVNIVNPKSLRKYYKAIATSAVVVTNSAFPSVPKSKKQYFIQAWHGDRAFKKILYDNEYGKKDFYRAESEEGFCDLCVAGSDYGIQQFRTGFRYKGEIMVCGTPRDDVLVNPDRERAARVREFLGIDSNRKIFMYAPTLRADNQNNHKAQTIQDIDLKKTLRCLNENGGEKWICLLRAHPRMSGLTGFSSNESIMDVSNYDDMTDLLLISDLLITDYSSCAGDFVLLKRPVILFQADRDEYEKHDRKFYFDLKQSPYMIANNQEELEELINSLNEKKTYENCRKILDFYNTTESGNAAETVVKRILEKMGK